MFKQVYLSSLVQKIYVLSRDGGPYNANRLSIISNDTKAAFYSLGMRLSSNNQTIQQPVVSPFRPQTQPATQAIQPLMDEINASFDGLNLSPATERLVDEIDG